MPPFRAVVLAAGLGTRLRPLTHFLPKPLLPVVGSPLITHTLAALAEAGCERTAINLYYQGDLIADRLGARFEKMALVYSPEEEILGTLGALAPLASFLAEAELVVVINGDSLCRWPIKKVVRSHLKSGATATLLASSRAPVEAYGGGIGIDREDRVTSFGPGRDVGTVDRRAVFAGLHVFRPELVADLDPRPQDFISGLYEPLLEKGARIQAVESSRPWFDLGTPASFLTGVRDWARRRGPVRLAGRSWTALDADIAETATLRRSVVEETTRIGDNAVVDRSVVLPKAEIGAECRIRESIVGPGVELPPGTGVERRLVTRLRPDLPPRERDSVVGGLVYSPLS